MPIPTTQEWKTATHKYFSRRNGAIARIDDQLTAYHVAKFAARPRALRELRTAIENFKEEKRRKHGAYTESKRYDADDGNNIDTLSGSVELALDRCPGNTAPQTAMHVCGRLFDVKMADVDFSPNVRAAAKAKNFGGKSNYDIVKKHWEEGEGATQLPIDGGGTQSPYQQHEASLTQPKLKASMPFGSGLISLRDLNTIAAVVKRYRFAVCESITATVISECRAAGMENTRMEWIGIPYTKTTGHSIAVFDREGELNDPNTWGDACFIVDLWYFNFGMRDLYIYQGAARRAFVQDEINPYGNLKVMTDIQ